MSITNEYIIVAVGVAIWILAGFISAKYLTASNHCEFDKNISINKKQVHNIQLETADKIKISAWYLDNNSNKAVILLTGIRGDRRANISRAEIYLSNGYSVLMPDLRGTGMSEGDIISFGWQEKNDLKACYNFLIQKNIQVIGVHGCSLGAATITYSLNTIHDYDFIVLESCYDNLENAFKNRTDKYYLPSFAYAPIRYFIQKRIGAKISNLNPEKYIKKATCPILIMAGDSESQIKISETRKLYKNCSSIRKTLYYFKGGTHEDFSKRFPLEYSNLLKDWINNL